MKRLCIYVAYDKQNIIDSYIGYMLKELAACMDFLAVVYNGTGSVTGMDILEEYADEIFFRENVGLDAGAFKDALCNLMGWDKVKEYDELFLVNDSFFGPFRSIKDIIEEMEEKQVDFWGLSKHGECQNDAMGYFQEHIQTFFLAIRSRMLHSFIFQEYWEKLPYFTTWIEVVKKHELLFTDYFVRNGFQYAVLADNDINNSHVLGNNYTQYLSLPYELIRKRNFPFLKKKPLETNILNEQTQEQFKKALDYIEQNTTYDVDNIYHNIIRTMNVADLCRNLHIVYIVPSDYLGCEYGGKVCVAVFAEFIESAGLVLEYLEKLEGTGIKIRVFTEKEEVLIYYQNKGYTCRSVANKTEYLAVIKELGDYDYVCMLHDVDLSSKKEPNNIGKSRMYHIWQNLLKDYMHIQYIISCFEKDRWLGFLAPPELMFSHYFGKKGNDWKRQFGEVKKIVSEMGLQCQLAFNKQPITVTDSFWIRGGILKKISQKKCMDRLLSRFLWTYIVQDAGYYSGIVESSEYAAMNQVNQQYYLETIMAKIRMQYGDFVEFDELQEFVFQGAVGKYCRKYPKLYIYGTGYMARKYQVFIPDFLAYIVSDGQPKSKEIGGKKVIYLSEAEITKEIGIIICLDEKHQAQVIPMLESMGIHHYLCI